MYEIGNLLDKLLFGTKIHYNNVVYYPVLYSLIALNFVIIIGGLVACIRCRHRKEKPTRKKKIVKRKTTANKTKRKHRLKYSSSSSTTSDESDSGRSFKIQVVPKTRTDYPPKTVQTKTSAQNDRSNVKSMRTNRNYTDGKITRRDDFKTRANCNPRVFVPHVTVSTQTETIRPSVVKKTSSTQTNNKTLEQHPLTPMDTSPKVPNYQRYKHYSNYPENIYSNRQQNFTRGHPGIRGGCSPDKYECDFYRSNGNNMVTYPEENHNFYADPERKTIFGVHLKPVNSPQINLYR